MAETDLRPRHIPLDGAHNVRDLGGYPTRSGGVTRWGAVYRGDRLDELTPGDLARLAELGITTVFDLRSAEERERFPDPMPSVHVSVVSRMVANRPPVDFASLVDHDHGVRFMRDLYVGLLEHAGPEIGEVLSGLAAPDALPAMFHCTAGKDRTGVVAALLLEWLGVDRDTVLDDFELSRQYHRVDASSRAFRNMVDRGISPEAAAGALGAERSTMAHALGVLDDRYGGIRAYLTGPAGMTDAVLQQLRATLVG